MLAKKLSRGDLARATLARQLLLERATIDPAFDRPSSPRSIAPWVSRFAAPEASAHELRFAKPRL